MLIISVRDNENNGWKRNAKTKENKTKTKNKTEDRNYSERVRAKWLCCAINLDFLQLIRKVSLIFKSNLELVINYFKTKKIIRVKICCGGV